MMRSLSGNKYFVLVLALLALGALTVLAISLDEIPFRQAQYFSQEETAESAASPVERLPMWQAAPAGDDLLVWTLLGLLVVLIALVVSPEFRKRMLKLLIRVAFVIATILFVVSRYGDRLVADEPQEGPAGSPPAGMNPPAPVFEPPDPTSSFSLLVSFAIALFLLVAIWGLYRAWQRFRPSHNSTRLEDIARIARASLDELSSGQNSSDVIINCYLRMSDVVLHRRSLARAAAMTPHEFALRLEQAGLPGDAVRRLTRLFEAVRYGDRKSGPREVNEAVSCLQTILHYCGEPV